MFYPLYLNLEFQNQDCTGWYQLPAEKWIRGSSKTRYHIGLLKNTEILTIINDVLPLKRLESIQGNTFYNQFYLIENPFKRMSLLVQWKVMFSNYIQKILEDQKEKNRLLWAFSL